MINHEVHKEDTEDTKAIQKTALRFMNRFRHFYSLFVYFKICRSLYRIARFPDLLELEKVYLGKCKHEDGSLKFFS